MVWNSSQSSLYRAVEAHNSLLTHREEPAPPPSDGGEHIPSERCRAAPPQKEEHNRQESAPCREIPPQPPRTAPNGAGGIIERLLADSDTLLLAAVLFVLIHEKADKNLILAVAMILLM